MIEITAFAMAKIKKNKANAPQMFTNTRKAERKQKRQQKKVHRQEHYLKQKNTTETPKYVAGRFVKRPVDSPVPDINVKVRVSYKLNKFYHDFMY